ncbi:MAG: hypothetical protein Fur0018_05970 [Anaerolineales bacterium]
MEEKNTTFSPPRPIQAILSGFDIVATHLELLLFPIVLDLWLWLGPHMRLRTLLQPMMAQAMTALQAYASDQPDVLAATTQIWQDLMQRQNLFSVLRTYPVGVPSLMNTRLPMLTPWGAAPEMEVSSWGMAFTLWLGLSVLGILLGAGMFLLLAQTVNQKPLLPWPAALKRWRHASMHTLALSVLWMASSMVIVFPLALMSILPGGSGQVAAFCFGILFLWLLLPFLFSAHGIFLNGQPFWVSIWSGVRMVRLALPAAGLFFLYAFVISRGLDMLWSIPEADSWFSLVGVIGHAVTSTALLTASFVLYRDIEQWIRQMEAHLADRQML